MKQRREMHGLVKTPEYNSWRSMKMRCLNPKFREYKYWGGRGIKICERWMTFSNFLKDMGPRPDGFSIHRINNNDDYYPGNCRWASAKEQQRNTSKNVVLVIGDRSLSVAEIAEKYRINAGTVYSWVARRGRSYASERVLSFANRGI